MIINVYLFSKSLSQKADFRHTSKQNTTLHGYFKDKTIGVGISGDFLLRGHVIVLMTNIIENCQYVLEKLLFVQVGLRGDCAIVR